MLAGTGQNYKLIAEMIPKGQKMYKYIFFVFLVSNKFIILNIQQGLQDAAQQELRKKKEEHSRGSKMQHSRGCERC
jgi:predicted Fe-Mo cluster-binding NifX family protein